MSSGGRWKGRALSFTKQAAELQSLPRPTFANVTVEWEGAVVLQHAHNANDVANVLQHAHNANDVAELTPPALGSDYRWLGSDSAKASKK